MTQQEIRELLRLRDSPEADCTAANRLIDEHIHHVEVRIAELRSLQEQLRQLRAHCQTAGSSESCGILRELEQPAPPSVISDSCAEAGHLHVPGCTSGIEVAAFPLQRFAVLGSAWWMGRPSSTLHSGHVRAMARQALEGRLQSPSGAHRHPRLPDFEQEGVLRVGELQAMVFRRCLAAGLQVVHPQANRLVIDRFFQVGIAG